MRIYNPSGRLAFEVDDLTVLDRICPETILYTSADEIHLPDCATCSQTACPQPTKRGHHARLASGAAHFRRRGALRGADRVR